MKACAQCGQEIDDTGFRDCPASTKCGHDRASFMNQVSETKNAISIELLARIERNELPACFDAGRALAVALAMLAMEALRQNQAMVGELRHYRSLSGPKGQ